MERHGENEQARWRSELDAIRSRYSSWIDGIISAEHTTHEQQIDNLVDTLLTWQQLCIQMFDTLEIMRSHVDDSRLTDFEAQDYAHTYSNAVHAFESAGVDNHLRRGFKESLVERYD